MNQIDRHYRPDIDGLRAVAILSVVGFHLFGGWIPGGFVGVDIFFVISGFLITTILERDIETGKYSVAEFYRKRIRRIFPSLLLVLATVLLGGWLFLLPDELALLGKHVAGSAAFIQNFNLMQESGYFDPSSELKPLLHLWSLSIEEQFYIFWPLLLFWLNREGLHKFYSIVLLFLISFFIDDLISLSTYSSSFYFTPSRVWQMLAGAAVAVNPWRKPISVFLGNFLSSLGFLLIIFSIFSFQAYMDYPGVLALVPTLGTALLISTSPGSAIFKFLALKPLVYIGLISYPLYLWHWPLISYVHILNSGEPSMFVKVCILLISFILSIMTYHFLEKPIRRSQNKKIPHYLLGLMILCGALGMTAFLNGGFPQRKIMKEYLAINGILKWKYGNELHKQCGKITKLKTEVNFCQISSVDQAPTVAIIGDSHAEHFYQGLEESLKKTGENLILLGNSGCAPFMGLKISSTSDHHKIFCEAGNNEIFRYILSSPTIHTVILANYGPVYIDKTRTKLSLIGDAKNENPYFFSANSTFKALKSSGRKVHYILNIPILDFDPKVCIHHRPISLSEKSSCLLPKAAHLKVSGPHEKEMRVIAQENNVNVIDASKPLCHESGCMALKDHKLLYRDDNHLTIEGSHLLGPYIFSRLKL